MRRARRTRPASLRQAARAGNLTLLDRDGREQAVLPGSFPWEPHFSPDGRRVAYAAGGPGPETGDVWAGEVWLNDVWITDVVSGTTQRVTADGKDNNEPRWSPDGTAAAYSSAITPGDKAIFVQTLDGAGPRPLTRGPGLQWPSDWTPDGRAVLFTETRAGGSADIWIQPLDGAARPYLATPAQEHEPRVSPDARWVAYSSDETRPPVNPALCAHAVVRLRRAVGRPVDTEPSVRQGARPYSARRAAAGSARAARRAGSQLATSVAVASAAAARPSTPGSAALTP